MKSDSILIAGDLYLPPKIEYDDVSIMLDHSVVSLFEECDFRVVNLEAPICKEIKQNKIIKSGPNLINDEYAIDILKHLKVDLLTLANNHIKDYGMDGVNETLRIVKKNKFDIVGVGNSFKEASSVYYKILKYNKIAIINIAENEWASANEKKGGANPFNIVKNVKDIKKAKQNSDIVIVIIHGGHEQYDLPSPRMSEIYRFFIEEGADFVVGHHPHCYSGYEQYKEGYIFYSLGNFIFPYENEISSWYEGFVLQLDIDEEHHVSFKLHPYEQCKNKLNISMMSDEKFNLFEKNISQKNKIIKDTDLLNTSWEKYLSSIDSYNLSLFSLLNVVPVRKLRGIFKKLGLGSLFLPQWYLVKILNQIRCESHQETSVATLRRYLRL